MQSKAKLRAAVIGLGVGEAHIAGFNTHPDCEVTRACDFSEPRLQEIRNKYPDLDYTLDANEILDDPSIDVVSIASYDNYHHEQVMRAVKAGKHVFVEKPLCLYADDARSIREELRKKPELRLSSNLILRVSPRFLRLKQMVNQNELGEVYAVDGDYLYGRKEKIVQGWRGKIDFYSVVYGGAVHLIDLLMWVLEDEIEEVFAYGNQIPTAGSQFRFPDYSCALLKFKRGIIGKVTSNYSCVHPHFHDVRIFGSKATFTSDFERAKVYHASDKNAAPEPCADAYPGVHKGDLIKSFIDSIRGNGPAKVTQDDVFRTMSVCFAIEESMVTGRPVKVNYI